MNSSSASADPAPGVPYRPHIGPSRQYVRDMILGVNDGLVSVFLLVAGVVGGGLNNRQVLVAAVAATVAGAVSMAAGEYVATKSQEEVFDSEMELEREHLHHHRHVEQDEIREMFGEMGLSEGDVERVLQALDRDDDAFLRVMMALEFGIVEEGRRSPITAAVLAGLLFLVGSAPSVIPFTLPIDTNTALIAAAVASLAALFTVGVVKTRTTRRPALKSGVENMAIAVGGSIVSYGIGSLFRISTG